jgi:hypothetical protein
MGTQSNSDMSGIDNTDPAVGDRGSYRLGFGEAMREIPKGEGKD